ncbi:MAG: PQQ-dependent dehydrogenase, methanol/ethanol family [Gammaproteobacteria bacterium]|nr:PQQ-dependent dehydrogenase, methanol/ethanol family [Gammaproteobacteria bacterium]
MITLESSLICTCVRAPLRARRAWPAALLLLHALGASAVDAEWPMASGDYGNTRYSTLADIDTSNVGTLADAFAFDTGVERGQEAAPIVVGGTLYLLTAWPNVLYALDLTRPGAAVKWKFEPHPAPRAQGEACCDVVTRGIAYADGTVFMVTLDGQAIAVDAATGAERWRTPLADVARGETVTMAPLVVKDRMLVGNSGGEMGVRGWLTALDTHTGAVAWRAYSTGPDRDVLIDHSRYAPFYPTDRGTDLGVATWPPEAWKRGGGGAWGFVSYDPALDLLYYGTANPGPWNPEQRAGDNKWTSGVFARRPGDGTAAWFYQWSPHDRHDYDGINEMMLLDLDWRGARRQVLVHPDRNGYVYVLDRKNGEVLAADPFVTVNTSTGVDLKTGRLQYDPGKDPRAGLTIRNVCPAAPGAKDWQPSAYSPRTGLLYLPHQHLCHDAQTYTTSYIAGTPFLGVTAQMNGMAGTSRGAFTAWDPLARHARWTLPEVFPVWSGALATAGDLVFYGTLDGWFKAVDARSGKPLWQQQTGSGIIGQPMAYRGPDGREYVAIMSGVGGWAGAVSSGRLDRRDGTAALGFVGAMKDLPMPEVKTGVLHVYALP